MIIKKIKDKTIGDFIRIEIPFWQHKNNPYDEEEEKELTHNLIGVIAGDDFTISKLNDLSYKDSQQEGMPLVHFWGTEPEFILLCHKLSISYIKHAICHYCRKVIYGSFKVVKKGNQCFECELKEKNPQTKRR